MESKCHCEVFCLWAWKGFSQGICCHVVGRTINEFKRSIVNDKSDEVVVYVNVFRASVVIVEIESASLDYSCDQDKKENGISGCLCEVQRQTDG